MKCSIASRSLTRRRLAAVGVMALLLSGIASGAAAEGRVAALFSSPITDKGFSQVVFEALRDEAGEMGFEFAYTDGVPASAMVESLRGYARSGAAVIVGTGEAFTPPALQVGGEFPGVNFAIVNSNGSNGSNVASVFIDQWPLGYLAGVVAASQSQTGTLGIINGMEFTSTQRIADGFSNGAKSVDPNISVLSVFTGDFSDPAKGRAAATAMISGGADVIVSALDLGAQGIVAAAKQAGDVHMIGFFVDQAVELREPELFYTSAIANWPEAAREIVRLQKDGNLEGKSYVFAVEDPRFAYLAPYGPAVTDETKQAVEAALESFRKGELRAP